MSNDEGNRASQDSVQLREQFTRGLLRHLLRRRAQWWEVEAYTALFVLQGFLPVDDQRKRQRASLSEAVD